LNAKDAKIYAKDAKKTETKKKEKKFKKVFFAVFASFAFKKCIENFLRQNCPMNIKTPLALLGGLSAEQFMRTHWQKKPLLIRGAMANFKPLLSEKELFDLAASDEVESRLIEKKKSWQLAHGPVAVVPSLKKKDWTLLVQGVDLHSDAVHALMQQFRFVPDARLDDVMISIAGEGGGVGPHFDSYDVFLLQAAGRRRWQISAQKDLQLVADAPLKILQHFKPAQEWVLEPGDMLYLPPRYAHEGVALDAGCQTYSMGFRAPRAGELARELLHRLAEEIGEAIDEGDPSWSELYADKLQEATAAPGQFPAALQNFALQAIEKATQDKTLLQQLVGEYLTDPKPQVFFDAGSLPKKFASLQLARATRMSYDAKHVFINGHSFVCKGADMRILKKLADARSLQTIDLKTASAQLQAALGEFAKEGWLYAI
jgi:50S ribosomal protein L16 3-hydroxylase